MSTGLGDSGHRKGILVRTGILGRKRIYDSASSVLSTLSKPCIRYPGMERDQRMRLSTERSAISSGVVRWDWAKYNESMWLNCVRSKMKSSSLGDEVVVQR